MDPQITQNTREVRIPQNLRPDNSSSDAITWDASVVQGTSSIWGPQTAQAFRELWESGRAEPYFLA
jgi:hypothetical protein